MKYCLKDGNYLNSQFKQEWSPIETEGIESIVQKAFASELRGKSADNYFGLVYTSSSAYAMLNVLNAYSIEEYVLIHFGLTVNDVVVMVCWDENENEYHYVIEDWESGEDD